MPVPIERNAKSSTPRATPRQRSPSAARLTSFSTATGDAERAARARAPSARAVEARRRWSASPMRPLARLDDAGHADDHAVDRAPASPAARRRARRAAPRRGERALGAAPASSTSWRARTSPAGRTPRRARSARRRRSRARAPPRRPARRTPRRSSGPPGSCGRLAHEPRVEQALQGERHRRLRDARAARDLGARDRCAGADRLEHRRARSGPSAAVRSRAVSCKEANAPQPVRQLDGGQRLQGYSVPSGKEC